MNENRSIFASINTPLTNGWIITKVYIDRKGNKYTEDELNSREDATIIYR